MKIMCRECNGSKFCHIISQKTTNHHSEHGIDQVTMAQVKIHKHHKGKEYCKGSDKIIEVCLEDEKISVGYQA